MKTMITGGIDDCPGMQGFNRVVLLTKYSALCKLKAVGLSEIELFMHKKLHCVLSDGESPVKMTRARMSEQGGRRIFIIIAAG